MVTINGHEASISMVDVVPYILSSGGVGGQVQVAREEIGIKLDILPTYLCQKFKIIGGKYKYKYTIYIFYKFFIFVNKYCKKIDGN